MRDEDKTKDQLIRELMDLRQRTNQLEKSKHQHKGSIETITGTYIEPEIQGLLDAIPFYIMLLNNLCYNSY